MNKTEIKLLGIYEGRTGEQRKIIGKTLDGWGVKYEVVQGKASRIGLVNIMYVDNFARWAVKRPSA